MTNPLETLANAIKRRMKERGVTQVELQGLSKVTQSQLSQYLNQKMAPTLENLARIADALDTTPADLLGGVSQPPPPPETEALLNTIKLQQEEIRKLRAPRAAPTIPSEIEERLRQLAGHRWTQTQLELLMGSLDEILRAAKQARADAPAEGRPKSPKRG